MTIGGVQLDSWDYVTFAAFFVIGVGAVGSLVLILGLPGRIAISRNHPEAEAVNLMSWLGFLAVVPWVQALIWSLKPTNIIDVRRWPAEEQRAIASDIAKLKGNPEPSDKASDAVVATDQGS